MSKKDHQRQLAAARSRQRRREVQESLVPRQRPAGEGIPDPVRAHVRKVLENEAAWTQAQIARVRQIEADGGRIVDSDQPDSDRPEKWEIRDVCTNELLAEGDDSNDINAVYKQLDPDEKWWGYETATEGLVEQYGDIPPTSGIPESLCEALQDWVTSLSTDDEDIAEVAGCTVEHVRHCRTDALDLLRRAALN